MSQNTRPLSSPVTTLLQRTQQALPYWACNPIKTWDHGNFAMVAGFATQRVQNRMASINVHGIVGTLQDTYPHRSWLSLLHQGEKMPHNLALHASHHVYYLRPQTKKPVMDFVSVNQLEFYVANEGMHRSCIAKFDFHHDRTCMLHGVELTQYTIDWEFYRRYRAINALILDRRLPYRVMVMPQQIRHEETADWRHDTYAPLVLLTHIRRKHVMRVDRGQLGVLLGRWKGQHYRRSWPSMFRILSRWTRHKERS